MYVRIGGYPSFDLSLLSPVNIYLFRYRYGKPPTKKFTALKVVLCIVVMILATINGYR